MIPLISKGKASSVSETIVGIVFRDKSNEIVFLKENRSIEANVVAMLFAGSLHGTHQGIPYIENIKNLIHFNDGDIVSINSAGTIATLFRIASDHNALFVTDRCNSNCLMCSQPPRNSDDLDYYYQLNNSIIELLPPETEIIGITGGEPTILGDRLIELIKKINGKAPTTSIHMLSNGRSFMWKGFAQKFSNISNNLIIGIPLYSDNYLDHDYIVQAKDAFTQTCAGLHNLARFNIRIEIRVVLHKLSYKRLPQLAKFIYKNFPFVEHVALMGLEYIGYTPFNDDKLWIEPYEYMDNLEDAALFLSGVGMNVSIYNLQLCLLRPSLWRFSKKSISDWKRDYLDECSKCSKLTECGGVFATSKKLSRIAAIVEV